MPKLSLLFLAGCLLTVPRITYAAVTEETVFPGKDWTEAAPEDAGVDPARLAAALAYLETSCGQNGISEVVVIRHGRMIWQGTEIDSLHPVWSCTKSFASIVTGLLYDDGLITSETRLADLLPVYEEYYPDLRIHHTLALTDGFGGHEEMPPFAPKPPLFSPGEQFHYAPGPSALARALTAAADVELAELFTERIAKPIGMRRWLWGDNGIFDPGEHRVNEFAGKPTAAVQISAREMARVGLLLLNRGNWDGQQLLSEAWINLATQPQAGVDTPLHKPDAWYKDIHGAYGYLFWVNGVQPDGELLWPHAPAGTFALQGNRNNICLVIPVWDMVVVRLGTDKVVSKDVYDTFFAYLDMAVE